MRYDGPGKHYYICDRCGRISAKGGILPEWSKHERRNMRENQLCITKIAYVSLEHETYNDDGEIKSVGSSQMDLCRQCSEALIKFLGFQELTEKEANIMCDEEDIEDDSF